MLHEIGKKSTVIILKGEFCALLETNDLDLYTIFYTILKVLLAKELNQLLVKGLRS
jgi:hypothetical protein